MTLKTTSKVTLKRTSKPMPSPQPRSRRHRHHSRGGHRCTDCRVNAVAEEAAAIATRPEEEIRRLQHLLKAEHAATAAATAAAEEATATVTNQEVEIRHLQLLVTAEKAATAS